MAKKIIAYLLTIAMTASIAVAGTVAYLKSEDSDVNVMTLGNVEIEQIEQERDESGALVDFTQAKPAYPAVGPVEWAEEGVDVNGTEYKVFTDDLKNVVDKIVTVKNTGKSPAYVRTIVAIEAPGFDPNDLIHINYNDTGVSISNPITMTVDGVEYVTFVFTYEEPLEAGAVSAPSLMQVFLDSAATNEDVAKFGETWEIIVVSQAGQVNGFEAVGAAEALNTMFGDPAATCADWLGGAIENDKVENNVPADENAGAEYNGTVYASIYEAVAAANANGGGTITLLGSAKLDKAVEITSDITLVGDVNGRDASYTRAEGYTGTMFTVEGATLTVSDLTLDGTGAAAATGNLIEAKTNGNIVLNEGAVLTNNNGEHAVSLGTRIGATLTLNGGEITNNSSGSGAIWGGGNITINSGKINNNSSTGSAGAIRMVSGCNLTMNGGEICNNTAVASGGAIYGYGSSVYNYNGGKMSGNTAAVGGAMYTGDSSVINVSGDFEMSGNTADEAGAMRLSNRTTLNMTGGKIEDNVSKNRPTWDGFYGWNPAVKFAGGVLNDDVYIQGGLTPTVGKTTGEGVIHFDVSTNHNTVNLVKDFGTIKFTVAEGDNFAAFNFKPAADYVYAEGDEAKLVCMNEGYETYWTGTVFKLQVK